MADLRVLYVNPYSRAVSGPDESLLTLLGQLVHLGVEPHVVLALSGPQVMLPQESPQVERYRALGARVHFAPLTALERHPGPGVVLFPARLARGAAALARIARRERIDLVHTNMEVVLDGGVAAKLLGIPHVLHYRGNTLDRPKLVFDVLTRAWVSTADRVFCISAATAAIFRKRGLASKVEVLHNPVDLGPFSRAERSDSLRAELGAGPTGLLVGAVGRIAARKDLSTYLRAAAVVARNLPSARFVVIGPAEGPVEAAHHRELLALASQLGIESRLVWAGTRRDIPEVLRALDLFVLSSRHEGFGRVVAESMAAGTAMVVSREGAMPELVTEGLEGMLATPGDADDFATRIEALLRDPGARARMGEAGRRRAEAFGSDRVAAVVRETYDRLVPRASRTIRSA